MLQNDGKKPELNSKKIPIYQYVRNRIDNFSLTELQKKPNVIKERELKSVLKIIYLFGGESGELIGNSDETNPIKGNDFYQTSIGDEEAIILSIPTNRKGARFRDIAVPLNPRYESWTKDILEYTEDVGEKSIWKWSYGQLTARVRKLFSLEMPVSIYREKADKTETARNITLKSLREIRLLELGLCYNFNEYDFKHFCGDIISPDYNVYFNKLMNKSDFYNDEDVYKLLELKNIIFSPQGSDKYNYKDYMNIVKKINRSYIKQSGIIKLKIDKTVDYKSITTPQSGSPEHKILMKNAEKEIKKIYGKKVADISYETANLDVVAKVKCENNNEIIIIIECGDSYAHKLLESFSNVYDEVKNVSQFWVLNYWDEEKKNAEYYKFHRMDYYR